VSQEELAALEELAEEGVSQEELAALEELAEEGVSLVA
jgi:hypothetical protein